MKNECVELDSIVESLFSVEILLWFNVCFKERLGLLSCNSLYEVELCRIESVAVSINKNPF